MKYFLSILFVVGIGLSGKNAGAAANVIPLKDFFRNPTSSSFKISSDGKTLAYLKGWKGRMNIHIRAVDAPESTERRLSSVEERDISSFFWKGSENIFYSKDFGGDENFHIFRINVKTGDERDLTPFEKTRVELVDDLAQLSDRYLLISHNHRKPSVFDVYQLDLQTNAMKMVHENPGDIESYLADQKGALRLATRSVGTDTEILFRESDKVDFLPLLKFDYNHAFIPLLFLEDGQRFLALSNLGRDTQALVEYDLKSKKETRILFQRSDYDLEPFMGSPLIYSYKQKRLLGLSYLTWKLEQSFFEPSLEAIYSQVAASLPTGNIILLSMDKSENKMIFLVSSDRQRGTYYLYDVAKKNLTKLDEAAPWLKYDDLAEMRPIQFRTRDGLTVSGYMVLPKDYKEGTRISFVVNPHGGPWARDEWRFNPEVQFLANRGHGVLLLNFRGSTGYGKKFLKASYGQWGLAMQDDITDGTKWLISQGYADPKHICIYGGSYGGYATLMGLVKEPDLYACGVDYVGVSNLFTFMKTIPPYWEPFLPKLHAMVGNPEGPDKERLTKTSPALNVDRIKSPLFIVQGAKDPRVNKDESDQMVINLKARGVEVPYLVKENEGHGFRNEENRFEFYSEMEKFLKQHLK